MIQNYPHEWIHVYTDDSAFKATPNAGYGVMSDFLMKRLTTYVIHVALSVVIMKFNIQHLSNTFVYFCNYNKHSSKNTEHFCFTDSLEALNNKNASINLNSALR
jgi:hypothetical protein